MPKRAPKLKRFAFSTPSAPLEMRDDAARPIVVQRRNGFICFAFNGYNQRLWKLHHTVEPAASTGWLAFRLGRTVVVPLHFVRRRRDVRYCSFPTGQIIAVLN